MIPARSPPGSCPEGAVVLRDMTWTTEDLGLPTRTVDLPVRGGGWLLGHFLLTPTPGTPVSPQQLAVAVAIADQVGASLLAEQPDSVDEHERTYA